MQVDFINIAKEIHRNYPDNKENIHRMFAAIVEKRKFLPEDLSTTLSNVTRTYTMNRPFCDIPAPPYRDVFDRFLTACKKTLSPKKNALFLRYLSLYSTGKISHRVFIRLFLITAGQEKEQLLPALPQFLTAVNSGALIDKIHESNEKIDDLALELTVSATAMAEDEESPKSLSKCLKLMSEGVIRPEVAKKWLKIFCDPHIMAKLDTVDDFSVFHPGNFPSDVVMANDFDTSCTSKNVFELYHDSLHRRYDPHSLRPVVVDILLLKMKEIRRLIIDLTFGIKVDEKKLSFMYGEEKAREIAKGSPNYVIPVVSRLVEIFTTCRDELIGILKKNMKKYAPDHFEYRILYKKMMNHNTLGFVYELPGSRTLNFGTRHAAEVAIAVTRIYASRVLEGDELNKVEESMMSILPLFREEGAGKYFVVNENIIFSVVYLAEIAQRIMMQGNIEEVVVSEELLLAPVAEQGPFGKDLYLMVDKVKQEENALKGFMAVCDIALVRVLRSLFNFESTTLEEFPEGIDAVNIYMTMTQLSEPEFGIVCNSAFSPCFLAAATKKKAK